MDADTLILTRELATSAFEVLRPVVIGTCGGLAAIVAANKRPDAKSFISCVVVSGFAAWLAGKFANSLSMSQDSKDVVMGVAGLAGAVFLSALAQKLAGTLGLNMAVDFDIKERGKGNKQSARRRQKPPEPEEPDAE